MVTSIWIKIGSGNGLLPEGSKPLPKPVLTYHQRCALAFTWEQFYKKSSQTEHVTVMCSEIILLKLLPHFPGTNELTYGYWKQTGISKCISMEENDCILIHYSLKWMHKCFSGPSALVYLMACYWIHNKPLAKPMVERITEVLSCQGTISLYLLWN